MNQTIFNIALYGPALFIIVATILGAITPKYHPLKHTISELALGKFGTLQELNFAINGGLIVALGVLLLSGPAPFYQSLAVTIMGGIMVLSAVFRTDPVPQSGVTEPSTPRGAVHLALFMIGIIAVMTAQLAWSLHNFGTLFSIYSLISGLGVLLCFIFVIARPQRRGTFQRILLVDIMLWITLFALSYRLS